MQPLSASKPKYVQWNDINSVGLEQLDAEHQHLVELINQAFDLVSEASGPDNLLSARRILNGIVEHTNVHFEHEESILESLQYPDLEEHRLVHLAMRQRMLDIRKRFDRWPTYSGARAVLRILKDWWTTHINRIDSAYAPHVGGQSGTLRKLNVETGESTDWR